MDSLEGANSGKRESSNPQEEEGKEQPYQQVKRFCSIRYAMAIMIHCCNLIACTQNFSLSIAIIAMVNHTGQSNQSNVSTNGYPDATADTGGMNYGALSAFWPKWAPPLERTQLSTIGISGMILGTFIAILGGGFLCESPGWPSVFYIYGGIGCVYCIIWFSLVYDDPINHPLISECEKEYITSSMSEQANSPSWSLPFKAMIKTMALWAILVGNVCRFWLMSNLTTSLPTLLDNMFDLNFEKNGFLSALTLLTSWVSMTLGGYIADFLLSKKILRLITVRKLFTFLGMFFPSLFTILIPYVDSTTAIAFLILASTMSTLCYAGFVINPLDIAPRYASFLMSLATAFTLISGLISPVITGYFISQDATGWKNVFFLSSAINLLGMVFYLIFGQTDVQDWAREHKITRF
ncbi:sodium-dependent phosphate transport protein 4-like isoform X3 [Notamacropus eugenii]|uniref:sodium-dependent phosphate transport protein 4-like isoform X3 n=1 Tax=Notamacropus eugenii TaxID=9315 RepID=UPI003B6790F6